MHKTPFAGLTELDTGDQIFVDGGSFVMTNPRKIDRLLQVGAVSHRHDAHPSMGDPTFPPSAWVQSSGGSIPASQPIYVGYTVEDGLGGESRIATVVNATTQNPVNPPSGSIAASADYSAGSLLIGNYYYGITFLDAGGGETPLGPTASVSRNPGFSSAQVKLSGLATELTGGTGPIAWRLWRSTNGQSFQLLASGTGNTFTDTGIQCTDCTVRPPDGSPGSNTTRSMSLLNVILPTVPQEPIIGSGAKNQGQIRLYVSTDGIFGNPCFYNSYPVSSAGVLIQIPLLTQSEGAPPDVSTCLPGAQQINPDTDILNFTWKRPVAASAFLPSGSYGDARLALDKGCIYAILASGGAADPTGWSLIVCSGATGGTPGPPGAPGAAGSQGSGLAVGGQGASPLLLSRVYEEFRASGEAQVAVGDLGGGSAAITFYAPPVPGAPASPTIAASGGSPILFNKPYTEYGASGEAQVAVQDMGGGSARIIFYAPVAPAGGGGSSGPYVAPTLAGSGGVTPLYARPYTEYAAVNLAQARLEDLGGGSARVLLVAGIGAESVASASWQDNTGGREWIMGSASGVVVGGIVAEDNYQTMGASPLANYTNLGNSVPTFVQGTGLRDQGADFTEPIMRWDTQAMTDQQTVRMKYKWDNPSNWMAAGAGTGTGLHNAAMALIDFGSVKLRCTHAALSSVSDLADAGTGVALTGGAPAAGSTGWLELIRNGNQITVNEYRADPAGGASPNTTLTFTLVNATDVANLGAGTSLKPMFWSRSAFTHPGYTFQDLQIIGLSSKKLHGIWAQASGDAGSVLRKVIADDGSSDFYDIPWGQKHRFLAPVASAGKQPVIGEIWASASLLTGGAIPGQVVRDIRVAVIGSGGQRDERILLRDSGYGSWVDPFSSLWPEVRATNPFGSGTGVKSEIVDVIAPNAAVNILRDDLTFSSQGDPAIFPAVGRGRAVLDLFGGRWHVVGAPSEAAFQNSWVNFGGTNPPAAYRKHMDGLIELKGLIKSGVVGNVIFTLPSRFRPLEDHFFPVVSNGAFGSVKIAANGDVSANSGSNVTFSLDGIVFTADGG